jgi:hypothetical protein
MSVDVLGRCEELLAIQEVSAVFELGRKHNPRNLVPQGTPGKLEDTKFGRSKFLPV